MKKEYLRIENVNADLWQVVRERINIVAEWRFRYIIPISAAAITIGLYLQNFWLGFFVFSFAIYHIVRYVIDAHYCRVERKQVKAGLARGNISISKVKLSHVSEQTIYEPHTVGRHTREYKVVKFFYFNSGTSWRMPSVEKFYSWSADYSLSPQGLLNTSVEGDEFYYIEIREYPDIAYVYPCDCFTLGHDLRQAGVEDKNGLTDE